VHGRFEGHGGQASQHAHQHRQPHHVYPLANVTQPPQQQRIEQAVNEAFLHENGGNFNKRLLACFGKRSMATTH
jgi:hypothetical protein